MVGWGTRKDFPVKGKIPTNIGNSLWDMYSDCKWDVHFSKLQGGLDQRAYNIHITNFLNILEHLSRKHLGSRRTSLNFLCHAQNSQDFYSSTSNNSLIDSFIDLQWRHTWFPGKHTFGSGEIMFMDNFHVSLHIVRLYGLLGSFQDRQHRYWVAGLQARGQQT